MRAHTHTRCLSPFAHIRCLSLFFLIAVIGRTAGAAEIELVTGEVLEGAIVAESETALTYEEEGRNARVRLTLPKARIHRLREGPETPWRVVTAKPAATTDAQGEAAAVPAEEKADTEEHHAPAADSAWPCWRGPFGNGTAAPDPARLIADPGDMRLVWKSEAIIPPSGRNHLGKWTSGFASPCVAEGRVFLFWYEGDGKSMFKARREGYFCVKQNRKLPTGQLDRLGSVAADEIVLCVDARTGKTLWRRVMESRGVNIQQSGSGKCGGHFSMAAADGKAFAIGTNGRAYCFEAATGELLWEAPTRCTTERERITAELVAAAVAGTEDKRLARGCFSGLGKMGRGRSSLPNACPAYADGVVWVYDTAFDAETGEVLWTGSHGNGTPSPVVWTTGGRSHFISGRGVCVEPRSGKVLWQAPDAPYGGATPAIGDGYLVLGGAKACYRISPAGAEPVWRIEHKGGGADMSSSSVVHDGYLYANTSHPAGHRREREKYGNAANLVCIELATGKEVVRLGAPSNSGSCLAFGPWILHERAGAGGSRGLGVYRADPTKDTLAHLGNLVYEGPYQDSVTPAIVGSRIYFRGAERLFCYELATR